MYLAYSLLLSVGLLVLIPYFLYQALAHGKYLEGLRQRLGSLSPMAGQRSLIWLHCVSVGETQAARPLVERLCKEFPDHALVVSTITRTGQKLAADVFGRYKVAIFYFPFDWRWSVRRALRAVNPSVVLLMETELWPNFLRECKAREIPVESATVSNVNKPATLENGVTITVPPFINEGDRIRVDPTEGRYIERAK